MELKSEAAGHYDWVQISIEGSSYSVVEDIQKQDAVNFAGGLLSAVYDLYQLAETTKEQIIAELVSYSILDEEDFSKPQ